MRRALFILTIFLNSGLLFLVQPLVARLILPVYGGSPAVWTASMVFFQAFLLLGYGYAHLTTRFLAPKQQAWLHVLVLVLAGLTLPFALPSWSGAVGTENPTPRLLGSLVVMVGASFFAVSGGSPLIQRWFSASDDKDAKDPYFLYSASNIGSLLALLAYPFLLEPNTRLGQQSAIWRWSYGALILAMGLCALVTRVKTIGPSAEAATGERVTNRERLLWLALSAVPSSLLLGVTAFLTTKIAPIPLLWVVPLSLYLLTFILAFAQRTILSGKVLGRVAPLIALPLLLLILLESDKPIFAIATVHLAAFFALAWMCHQRLVEKRPSSAHLTEFYLFMSLGGVIGGIFNAVVAPLIFSQLYEYPLAVVLVLALRPVIAESRPRSWQIALPFLALALTLGAGLAASNLGLPPGMARTLLTIGVPLILAMVVMDWPLISAGVAAAGIIGVAAVRTSLNPDTVLTERSFFGVHTVTRSPDGRRYELVHGTTIHGRQDRQHPERALTYDHRTGPIGKLMQTYDFRNVALVGLGVGSLATYGNPGEKMTFFEIDPVVQRIATDPKLFTFIANSKADVDFVMGDARLTLAEQPDAFYDLIVLDAFSSDTIPIHLLTREAFEMYLRKLQPTGILAVHISNRYLDLQPVLRAVAKDLRLQAVIFEDAPMTDEAEEGKTQATWVALARNEHDIAKLIADRNWNALDVEPVRVWTDDYSNVLGVFKREQD
jgi:hypothetical protein